MNTLEKTLEYHELLMIYSDTSKYNEDIARWLPLYIL